MRGPAYGAKPFYTSGRPEQQIIIYCSIFRTTSFFAAKGRLTGKRAGFKQDAPRILATLAGSVGQMTKLHRSEDAATATQPRAGSFWEEKSSLGFSRSTREARR